jgi:hypothetical protein
LFLLVRPSENQHRTPTTGLEGGKQKTVIENSHRLFQGAKILEFTSPNPHFPARIPQLPGVPNALNQSMVA